MARRICYSVAEEMARRIVEDACASDRLNVVEYLLASPDDDCSEKFNFKAVIGFHAWKDRTTPSGTVYVRTPILNKLSPGGFPCKSPEAVTEMIKDPEMAWDMRLTMFMTGKVELQDRFHTTDCHDSIVRLYEGYVQKTTMTFLSTEYGDNEDGGEEEHQAVYMQAVYMRHMEGLGRRIWTMLSM